MTEKIQVTIRRNYRATVEELYPDGVPDKAPGGIEWPNHWSPARRAAFALNHRLAHNPFEPSSFLKDFEGACSDEWASATVVDEP